jgi:DUF4097 and DUF4098 domain-containing protein YvlB
MFIRPWTLGVAVFTLFLVTPAAAEFRLERQLALPPGGTFTLDTQLGSVELVGDSTSGVRVTITSSRDDLDRRLTFDFDEQPGSVRVTAKRAQPWVKDWFSSWRSYGNVRFTVHVPNQTDVSVSTSGGEVHASRLDGEARLRTSGGRVRVEDVVGDVNAHTSGGSIRIDRVRGTVDAGTSGGGIEIVTIAGHVRADTSGGGITIEAASGDVSAETSGGAIRVRSAGGRVEAHTSGGPVSVEFAPGNARGGELSTSGGGVTAAVDPSARLSIDASTSGGGVTSDLALTTRTFSRNSVRGDLNGGGPPLRLRTSGGPIQISAAPPR